MRWLVKLGRRLRLIFDRRAVEREMDDELRFHLASEAAELERSGLDPAEARRRAAVAFGGVEAAKEESRDRRGGRLLDDLIADLRYTVRQAVRAPGHTAAVVGILAVAIAGATVSIALARAYLHRPLPFPHPDRLMTVIAGPSRDRFPNLPDLSAVDWAPAEALFEETAAWDLDGFTLVRSEGAPEYIDGAWVTPGFFELRGLRPALGRLFVAEEYVPASPVAIISDSLWRTRFGADPAIIGSAVRTYSTDRPDEDALVTIVGVLPPTPWHIRFSAVLRPLAGPRMFSLARLPRGVSADEAAARLTAVVRTQLPGADPAWRMTLVSNQDEHVHAIRPVLEVLLATGLLLLVLAHANVGALLVARGTTRAAELAVRRALGATRGRLLRQLAIEAGALGLVGLGLGLSGAPFLAGRAARSIEAFGGVSVPGGVGSVGVDGVVFGAIAVATLVAFLLLAVVPVLALAAAPGGSPAAGRATPALGALRVRRVLATLQIAVAVVLLAQGALLARSVRAMLDIDLGFEPAGLLKASVLFPRGRYPDPGSRARGMEAVLDRIRATPGVVTASGVMPWPFRAAGVVRIECAGCEPGPEIVAVPQVVTADYFAAMRTPLVTGRRFDIGDGPDRSPVAIVSETLARRLWPDGSGLGRQVRIAGQEPAAPWLTVIGIVADIRKTYGDTLHPDLYRPFAQQPRAYTALMVRAAGDPAALIDPIRRAVAGLDETLALSEVEPMADLLSQRRGRTGILAGFVGVVAGLSFLLTVAGLYAVVAYLVRVRRRELAIRAAMGALPGQIARAVLGEARWMLGAGIGLGLAGAAATAGLSRSQLVGVSAHDPLTYAVVAVAVAVVAALALGAPARAAGAVDPAMTLREE